MFLSVSSAATDLGRDLYQPENTRGEVDDPVARAAV